MDLKRCPPFAGLAQNVCVTGLALRIEAIELLVETLFRTLAGVDCAALHDRRPKKRGPFQRVPAISDAAADRLLKVRPFQSNPVSTTVTTCSLPFHIRLSVAPMP